MRLEMLSTPRAIHTSTTGKKIIQHDVQQSRRAEMRRFTTNAE